MGIAMTSDVEAIARICHEVNRVFCAFNRDNSQVAWDAAEPWQRAAATDGVLFLVKNPDAPDSTFHDQWVADKVAAGWVYGPVKSGTAKTHPCMVPFDELPADRRFKDTLFRTIVLTVMGYAS